MVVPKLPKRARFSLPDVLQYLKDALAFERIDLAEALKSGQLQSYCCPYLEDRDRTAAITPEQWKRDWPNDWEFPIYDSHVGDIDVGEFSEKIPLHIVPDEADKLLKFKDPKGNRLAESAEVYVDRKDLQRFVKEYLAEKSKPAGKKKRSHAGRPEGHDYSDIDQRLEDYLAHHGLDGFEKTSLVIHYLEERVGEEALPPVSSLRSHVARWFKNKCSN
ncbi:MAG: hypothetical protein RIC85_04245 [Gammaproteobacteria bacterium]